MNQTTNWPLGSRVPDEADHLAHSLTGPSKVVPAKGSTGNILIRPYDRLSGELRVKPNTDRSQTSGPVGWLDASAFK